MSGGAIGEGYDKVDNDDGTSRNGGGTSIGAGARRDGQLSGDDTG